MSATLTEKALLPLLLLLLAVAAANAAGSAGCGGTFVGAGIISPPRLPTPAALSRGSSGASGSWDAVGGDDGRGSAAVGGSTACTWNLVPVGGRSVDIRFTTMKLQKNSDSLSVYAGDLLVVTFTGNTLPPNLTFNTTARLVFRSDDTVKTRTFTAVFMSRAPSCGGLQVVSAKTSGSVITSPNFPNPYPNNAACTWTIVSPTSGKTRVQFTLVDLEQGNRDRLIVYDETDLTLRGSSITKPEVLHLDRTVFILFTSNASVQKQGFRVVINGPSTPSGGATGGRG